MSNNIRGLKRQSIIDNWLNGIEDPNFEVVPTKAEGKYIVKQRTGSNKPLLRRDLAESAAHPLGRAAESSLMMENMNNGPSEPQITSKQDDNSQIAKQEAENPTNKAVSAENDKNDEEETTMESPMQNYVSFDRELTNEILNQLKLINDDRRARDEKKQKKKELRRAIHKEFARSRVMVEDSSDEEPPQPIIVERPPPIRVRRRLNLLDRRR